MRIGAMFLPESASSNGKDPTSENNWELMLRSACEILRQAPAKVTTAVSVVGRAPCTRDEEVRLPSLAGRLADEYGFQGQVRLDRALPSVRFSRC